ncbi:Bifunctional L-3-cyanoalanine synthase/cysteine synthase [Vanrija pseudolonga]|uniref:Bifunctional L-3-cyanoalanine synthase/cysteine synthase n=1 Tax=Vanrija pseudolonga TaxID=143232 RepID=A0AAF0YAD7_9TREE|nr:Bifunctional L-3-cyanoalanine synthase/cysteine synthase [Vanrija pseudolonga]
MPVLASAVDAIGHTPLVRLDRLTASLGLRGTLLAKLDNLNPGGSKKDRPALGILDEAAASGTLAPGQTVVELTSGNTGTGLAIVCAVRGHPFVAVMSRGNSPERARMMAALGAEVVLVDQAPGSVVGQVSGTDLALVEVRAREVAEQRGAFRADQFLRDGNPQSHYDGTAQEIWDDTAGEVDAFVDFVGSGGTFAGTSRRLKELKPDIQCFVVEPTDAAILAHRTVANPDHPIQGGGYSMPDLRFLHGVVPDGYLQVSGAEARDHARLLATREGIFGGYSSGANLAAAVQVLRRPEMEGKTVVFVVCDSGLKYLSTDLWAELPEEADEAKPAAAAADTLADQLDKTL